MQKEFDCYIKFLHEDIEAKEGEEIRFIVRDCKDYLSKPVVAKVLKSWTEGLDKLYIRDPLGRLYRPDPWGIKIITEEDQEKLLDPAYQKCMGV